MQPVVYFDQNIWIELAKTYYGKNSDQKIVQLCKNIIQKSEKEEVIFPLSLVHMIETHHATNDKRRNKLIDFMLKVSRGYIIYPINVVRQFEIEVVSMKIMGLPTVDINDLIVKKGGTAFFRAEGRIQGNAPDLVKNEILQFTESDDFLRHMVKNPNLFKDKIDHFNHTEEVNKIRESYLELVKDKKMRENYLLFINFKETVATDIIKNCYSRGMRENNMWLRGWNESRFVHFCKSIPTFYVLFYLSYRSEMYTNRQIDSHDFYDKVGLSVAIPYSNIVVCEKMFASIAKQQKLDEDYNTIILSSLQDLNNYI
jgi:hypothetical protein